MPTTQHKTILLVEDDRTFQKQMQHKFAQEGFTLIIAEDGEEGLKKAQKDRPDLILLDIMMPKMDGMTMLEKLQKSNWGKDLPVMLVTNLDDADSTSKAAHKGVYDYLLKADWTPKQIVEKVKEKLGV